MVLILPSHPVDQMRRLSPKYKHWLLRRAYYAARKRRKPSSWKWAVVDSRVGQRLAKVVPGSKLPSVLCLDEAYLETVGFINDLRIRTSRFPSGTINRQLATHGGRRGWVRNYQDFNPLHKISPGAALLLAAEFDRARTLGGLPLAVVDASGWDSRVRATLSMLGFFDLLNLPQPPPVDDEDGFHVEPMASEMGANSKPAIERIVALFDKAGGNLALRTALCGAVIDALENVAHHAYPQEQFVGIRHVPNWWFTGAADRNNRWLILAVYDQGVTIPVTLPRRFGLESVKAAFQRWFGLPFDSANPQHDGAALDAAMRLSATSTSEHYRGKGLAKIRDVVRQCQGGQLRIVSRNGEYIFQGETDTVRTQSHPVALPGTYVEIAALF
jgi:hypothetical protein